MEQRAYEYLQKNRLQNTPALEALKRGASVVTCQSGGVILYDSSRNIYFVSVDDNALIGSGWWDKSKYSEVLALREQNIDAIVQKTDATHVMSCRQMVFLGKSPACPPIEGLIIDPLCEKHTDFVMAHYTMALERDYIVSRLNSGDVFGAHYHGTLVGFVGRHYDGSIGMLEVLPAFRRLHIGTSLACFMINRVMSLGETPYAHILLDNLPSLALTGSVDGAEISDELIAWID